MPSSAPRATPSETGAPEGRETIPTSGRQFRISAAGYVAKIASVGATLRMLRHGDRDLIAPFPPEALRPAMHGAVLVPWPGRTGNGAYEFDGTAHHLVIDEPSTGAALHGLTPWLGFDAIDHSTDRVRLRGVVEPRPGYPWRLQVDVEFSLGSAGLSQKVAVKNLASTRAPVGIGAHPYLVAGEMAPGAVDGWSLELPADVVAITDERLLPVRCEPVNRTADFDFRARRSLAQVTLNHAFTELLRSPDGMAHARVTDHSGAGVKLSWDNRCRWVQVYTADEATGPYARASVAVEPMTCPPDALNSKQDLIVLEPGQTTDAGWLLSAITPPA